MSNSDQRLVTGLKALAPGRGNWQPGPTSPGAYQTGENGSLLSLESLSSRGGETVPGNQLLGICEEVLERPGAVPAPGSLLVIGDPGSGKTRLLRRLMLNAAAHNTPEQAGFYLAAHQPAQFSDIGHLDHCRLVMQTYDRSLGPAVQELVDLAEERRAARGPGPAPANYQPGPAVILVIDDLASALLSLSEQSITLLYWLIRHGPRQRVWTLATLSTRRLADLDLRFLEAFRSRLVGYVSDPDKVQTLFQKPEALQPAAGSFSSMQASRRDLPLPIIDQDLRRRFLVQGLPTRTLEKGWQFFLPYGPGWIRFRLCEIQAAHCHSPVIRLWSGTA